MQLLPNAGKLSLAQGSLLSQFCVKKMNTGGPAFM